MTLIVFSDSHGNDYEMSRIIKQQKRHADLFLHLGDGAPDFLDLCDEENVLGYAVKGNCDSFLKGRDIPTNRVIYADGLSLYLAHGDHLNVAWSCEPLAYAAKEKGCTVALYGHTHVADNRYLPPAEEIEGDTPLYLVNPGSISRSRDGGNSYAKIDIQNGNVLINIVRL